MQRGGVWGGAWHRTARTAPKYS